MKTRLILSAALLPIIASCGNDSRSGPISSAHQPTDRADDPSSVTTPTELRAAYIRAIQIDAPVGYSARTIGNQWHMENEAQRFELTVDGNQLQFASNDAAFRLSMKTTTVGCETARSPVSEAKIDANGNQIRLKRVGLEEWYLNGPLGVEQGIVLSTAPNCAGSKVVTLNVGGDLQPRLDDPDGDGRGNMVHFVNGHGHDALAYTDLFVRDASGKTIPAWISVAGNEVALHLDDRNAAYPIEIDPLVWTQQTRLIANDAQINDQAGMSVSISGDTALVGAYWAGPIFIQGAAYVFVRNGNTWTQQAKLTANDAAMQAEFGRSVSLHGETALVGAWHHNMNKGAAYVYVRNGTTWTQQQKLEAPDGTAGDFFGSAVAISADTALIGAENATTVPPALFQGAAYVFVRSGTTWTLQQKIYATDNNSQSAAFGGAVALEQDTALIGARRGSGPITAQGAAYVFVRSGGTWTQEAKLLAADGKAVDVFGTSVALSGNTALIGAPQINGGNTDPGAAYAFVRNGTTWTQQQKLIGNDSSAASYFGWSVAIEGDKALIGAYQEDAPNENDGAAYIFTRSGSTWAQQQKLAALVSDAFDNFGSSVAISGNTALVGARLDEPPGIAQSAGSTYVFGFGKANGDMCMTAAECGIGYCTGGICGKPIALACQAAVECASGFCSDGVCCNSACGESNPADCQACAISASGSMDGTCTPLPLGKICRFGSAGVCDSEERCDGVTMFCPPDLLTPAGVPCRFASGGCDIGEVCTGLSAACPADLLQPAGFECRTAAGTCDVAEVCDGMAKSCPTNTVRPMGTICRPAANACDVDETCTGNTGNCPFDEYMPDGTMCMDGTCSNGTCLGASSSSSSSGNASSSSSSSSSGSDASSSSSSGNASSSSSGNGTSSSSSSGVGAGGEGGFGGADTGGSAGAGGQGGNASGESGGCACRLISTNESPSRGMFAFLTVALFALRRRLSRH